LVDPAAGPHIKSVLEIGFSSAGGPSARRALVIMSSAANAPLSKIPPTAARKLLFMIATLYSELVCRALVLKIGEGGRTIAEPRFQCSFIFQKMYLFGSGRYRLPMRFRPEPKPKENAARLWGEAGRRGSTAFPLWEDGGAITRGRPYRWKAYSATSLRMAAGGDAFNSDVSSQGFAPIP